MPLRVQLYVAFVATAAVALLAALAGATEATGLQLATVIIFLACHVVATEAMHRMRTHPALGMASITELDGAWLGAGVVLLPPFLAGLLAGGVALCGNLRLRRSAPLKVAFNTANFVLGFAGASLIVHTAPVPAEFSPARLAWIVVAIVLVEVISSLVRAVVIKLSAPATPILDALGFNAPTVVYLKSSIVLGLMVAADPAAAPYLGVAALPIVIPLQRQIMAEQMKSAAQRDGKTGLLRLEAWHDQLELTLRLARRARAGLGVIVVDIDHFKRVNDTVGHLVADGILAQVAGTIQGQLRPGDIAGRFGGEEFVVAFVAPSTTAAVDLAERIRAACVLHESEWADQLPPVTVSVGVAVAPCEGLNIQQLLTEADNGLLEAKRTGRNRVVLIDPQKALSTKS